MRLLPPFLFRLILMAGCVTGQPGAGQVPPKAAQVDVEEHELKARFLAKICDFVKWPPESDVNDPSKPFVIGILPGPLEDGERRWKDPFVDSMREIFSKTTLKTKKIILKPLITAGQIKECQAVYVMPRARSGIKLLMKGTQPIHILVFGQAEGFAELGVHLNFKVVDQRVRFEINEASFHDSGLKLDALILRSAIVVKRRETK